MECLEGQTLAARLERGPLRLADALRYAISIAEALAAAHRAGIVHRDVKPGNIMLSGSGAKLLDFGIAKLRPAPPLTDGVATESALALTADGTIVGTPQYMSPEQLEGRDPDARSDSSSFGAVLYEMVTGQKAFPGRSTASVIAAIMSSQPSMTELRKVSPPALEHLVTTCLIKEPERRWETAHDLVLELQWLEGQVDVAPPQGRKAGRRWPLIPAALVLVALGAAGANYFSRAQPPRQPMRLSILAPEDGRFEAFHAISPDGSRLAFTSRDPSGKTALWLRPLQSSTAVRIPGTDGAGDPFWSPDGGFIGFFAGGKLRVMSADAGVTSPSIQTLADVQDPRGGTWNRDGVIVFARNLEDGLYSVPSSGGLVKQLTTLDRGNRENSHRWPQFLPDGRHVLFLVRSATTDQQGIYVIELGSPDKKQLLLPSPASALVATFEDKAALLFMREQTLVAQPIDLRSLSLQGTPTPLAESLGILTNRGLFSVSDAGALTYRSTLGADENSAWFDATGKQLEPGPAGAFQIRVAPDGKHLAFGRADVQQGAGDIWLQDLERGGLTRFTTHRAYDWLPIWSPKGDRIVFASNRDGVMDLVREAGVRLGSRAPDSEERPPQDADRLVSRWRVRVLQSGGRQGSAGRVGATHDRRQDALRHFAIRLRRGQCRPLSRRKMARVCLG